MRMPRGAHKKKTQHAKQFLPVCEDFVKTRYTKNVILFITRTTIPQSWWWYSRTRVLVKKRNSAARRYLEFTHPSHAFDFPLHVRRKTRDTRWLERCGGSHIHTYGHIYTRTRTHARSLTRANIYTHSRTHKCRTWTRMDGFVHTNIGMFNVQATSQHPVNFDSLQQHIEENKHKSVFQRSALQAWAVLLWHCQKSHSCTRHICVHKRVNEPTKHRSKRYSRNERKMISCGKGDVVN